MGFHWVVMDYGVSLSGSSSSGVSCIRLVLVDICLDISPPMIAGYEFLGLVSTRCKMVNWLFTLGFQVQTNTDGSFLVILRQCMWSDGNNIGNNSNLARILSNNVRNITRIM